jgi:RNA polymerase sigma factor (sigma-70 family)
MTNSVARGCLDTRDSLLRRVRRASDQGSWQEFYSLYHPLIYSVARQSNLSHDEAEDVVQETMLRLTKKLPQFNYDPGLGSFRTYLRRSTRWCIIERVRRRLPKGVVSIDPEVSPGVEAELNGAEQSDPVFDASWDREEAQMLVRLATQRARGNVSDEMFQVYDCVVAKGWSVKKTATMLGITQAKVYLMKFRFLKALRREVTRLSAAKFA